MVSGRGLPGVWTVTRKRPWLSLLLQSSRVPSVPSRRPLPALELGLRLGSTPADAGAPLGSAQFPLYPPPMSQFPRLLPGPAALLVFRAGVSSTGFLPLVSLHKELEQCLWYFPLGLRRQAGPGACVLTVPRALMLLWEWPERFFLNKKKKVVT